MRSLLIRLSAVALCLALFASDAAAEAALSPDEIASVDKLVRKALGESGVPSASVAIVRDGQIAFAKAYGLRRLDPREAATPQTRYRIASVSKQFTAAAVLMLVDERQVSLDDPVAAYLPEIKPNSATVRQTLSHTAGFANFWAVDYVAPALMSPTTPQAIVDRWGATQPDFAPGSKWNYSNTGYAVLGRLVERRTGRSLANFLQGRVFNRLGMTSAADMDGRPPGPNDARGYTRAALGPPREATALAAGWTFGAGELAMTAGDLARWDISILDRDLLSSASYDAQARESKLTNGDATGYGLGMFVDRSGGHRRLRHNGDLPGFWTENRVYPDDRAAIVVMTNGSYGASPHAVIANGIETVLLGSRVAPPDSPPTPGQIVGLIYNGIKNGSLDRSGFTPSLDAYLSGQTLADYRASFQELGDPLDFTPVGNDQSDHLSSHTWIGTWANAKLAITLKLRSDGKIEEFYALPVWQSGTNPRPLSSSSAAPAPARPGS